MTQTPSNQTINFTLHMTQFKTNITEYQIYRFNIQMSFRKFLSTLGSQRTSKTSRFSLGNDSADYDSFFGSIIFAYMLTQTSGQLHEPLIDCPKKELKLRFEVHAVLEKMQIDPNIFKYRQSSEQPYPQGIYNLYDHNKRPNHLSIQYIVDHHQCNPKQINSKKYLIDKTGSTLTLLYYLLQPNKLKYFSQGQLEGTSFVDKLIKFTNDQPFEKLRERIIIDRDIKEIIRYGIFLDTFNLDPKQPSRWNIFDQKAIQFIEKQQSFQLGYQWLQSIKYDNQKNLSLTLYEMLAKDRKTYTYKQLKCIYSAILISPKTFYDHFEEQIKNILNPKQECDIYLIISAFKDQSNQFRRQIIYRIDHKHKDIIQQQLEPCFESLNVIHKGALGEWKWLEDPSKIISRKIFQPSIAKALNNNEFSASVNL